jgi:hypothetical protein
LGNRYSVTPSLPTASQESGAPRSMAPGIQKATGQKNNMQAWNPFMTSGWLSPIQSGVSGSYGPFGNGGQSGVVNNLLAMGV